MTTAGRLATRCRRSAVAAAGLLAIMTTALAPAAGAQTDEPSGEPDEGDAKPEGDVSTGAFEPCSAIFGFGKVGRVEVSVDGVVPTPPLTYPTDVDLVAEVTVAGEPEPVLCAPDVVTEQLWDDESMPGFFGIPYPGGNYIFIPQNEACPAGLEQFCPGPPFDPDIESVVLRIVTHPAQYVVLDGEEVVTPLATGYDVEADEVGRVFPFALGTPTPEPPVPSPLVIEPTFTG